MKTDIEIAQDAQMLDIREVAGQLGIGENELELYGRYQAKLSDELEERVKNNKDGKLILVTAINPTPAGEGKTTTSVGLGMAMEKIGKNAVIALREPSLGPVFGIKGGAAGGGYAQVLPMEDINLHFTGDFHAITAANNLLCAMIDNHIQQGNALNIDQRRIVFGRVTDTNDRALRNVVVGLGKPADGVPREDHFMITVASEVMAILCLADDLADLKRRLGSILVAYTREGAPVYARDLQADGAMAVLLKDAIKPNLVQTIENTPAIIHGGPFANIAHGCNSVRATKLALKLADYAITEAGFGADLGAEKFLDTKCRIAGIQPDCVVIVATVKALKLHGGADKSSLDKENLTALNGGIPNLLKHVENIKNVYKKPVVVAMNRFATDTQAEIDTVLKACQGADTKAVFTDVFLNGGKGGEELAKAVLTECEKKTELHFAYDLNADIRTKIEDIVKNIYGGDGADFSSVALKKIEDIESKGIKGLPVIIAKTQYSLSDDATKLARPEGFKITVRDIIYKGGANFIVAVAGEIMLMPGLSKVPCAEHIDIDENGNISGLS